MVSPPAPAAKRSGALTAVAVGALIYGFAGCGCGAAGVIGAFNQGQQAEQMRAMQTQLGDSGMADFMTEMTERGARWQIPSAVVQLVGTFLALAIFALGLLVMQWDPRALRFGPPLLWGALLWGLLEAGFGIYVQYDMFSAMPDAAASMNAPGMGQAMESAMGVGIGMMVCIGVGWAMVKGAFFAFSALHLKKPEVGTQFQAARGGEAYSPRGD